MGTPSHAMKVANRASLWEKLSVTAVKRKHRKTSSAFENVNIQKTICWDEVSTFFFSLPTETPTVYDNLNVDT